MIEFQQILDQYHHTLIFSYCPYHLQKAIQDHYHMQFGYIPPVNLFGLFLTHNVTELRNNFNILKKKSIENLFLSLLDGNIPNNINKILRDNEIPELYGDLLLKNISPFKASKFISNAYNNLQEPNLILLDNIDGWLSPLEGRILFEIASQIPSQQKIVEIGSWKGKSTSFLTLGSLSGNKAPVLSIDPHNWTDQVGIDSTFPAWQKTTEKYRKEKILFNIKKKSINAHQDISANCGIIFIDGAHDSVSVELDIEYYMPKLVEGGYLVFHDSFFPSVFHVLEKKIWTDFNFEIIDICEGLLITRYFPR